MEHTYYYSSPLGIIALASDGENLTGLRFCEESPENGTGKELPVFALTKRWLDIYFRGEVPCFTPPLHLSGTDFRLEVWEILKAIPYGSTATYGEIAKLIAERKGIPRMSAQAVGGAVGKNPVSIIIPCHRVVGSDGGLTGYAGGIDKKAALLRLEKRAAHRD